ncbi:MAG TPA: VC0807 family protein [Ilumatobacter sp.]|nr:VC0807 family protein [Ilumatobacter sp.]
MQHPPVVIPSIRAVLRHALPNVIEGKLVPLLIFIAFLELIGATWALVVALVWSLGAIAFRTATGRRVPGLIVLSATTLAARTVAALATGSMVVYFLQPTITTFVVGAAFLVSVPLGTPLARKLAYDVLPFDDDTKSHPLVERFFVRLSLSWAFTSLVNASITVWLLLTQTTTTFVVVKSVLGPITGAVTIGTMAVWFWISLSRSGTRIVWAHHRVVGHVDDPVLAPV